MKGPAGCKAEARAPGYGMLKRLFLGLAAAALAASSGVTRDPQAAAPAMDPRIAEIDRALTAAEAKGFGGAVIVKRGGEVLLARGYGFADRQRKVRFGTETMSQIGSITKSQTGAAIATLVAEGKIKLEDRVSKFVAEAPEPGRSRTIGQLLAHRSGLLDSCTGDFDRQSERKLVDDCLARPLAHPAGEDHYSNMGYSVLALIVQRVTGTSWEDAVRQRVWKPIGMEHIGFHFEGQDDDLFARGYLKDVEQPVISRSIAKLEGEDWALRGNGGLQASPQTMIRFLDAMLDPKGGFPAAARALMMAPLPGESGEVREGYGLAFRYEADGTPIRVGHAGSDGTFFSYLGWLAANDVRLYLVGNNGEDNVRPLVQQALKSALALPPAK